MKDNTKFMHFSYGNINALVMISLVCWITFTLMGVSYDIKIRMLGETTSCYWWLKNGATTDPFAYIAAADTWQTFTTTVIGDGGAFNLEIASSAGVNNYVRVAYLSIKETV